MVFDGYGSREEVGRDAVQLRAAEDDGGYKGEWGWTPGLVVRLWHEKRLMILVARGVDDLFASGFPTLLCGMRRCGCSKAPSRGRQC